MRIVDPNLPELPLPQRTIDIAATAACLCLTGWMLIVGILEHPSED